MSRAAKFLQVLAAVTHSASALVPMWGPFCFGKERVLYKYLVIAARGYRMTDEKTGEVVEGTSVHYIDPESGESNRTGELGTFPIKISGKPEILKAFPKLPAIAELKFAQRAGAGGKAALALTGVGKVWPVDVETLMLEAA